MRLPAGENQLSKSFVAGDKYAPFLFRLGKQNCICGSRQANVASPFHIVSGIGKKTNRRFINILVRQETEGRGSSSISSALMTCTAYSTHLRTSSTVRSG